MSNNTIIDTKQLKPDKSIINLQSHIMENRKLPINIYMSKMKLNGKSYEPLRDSTASKSFVKKKKAKNGLITISSYCNVPVSANQTNLPNMKDEVTNHLVGRLRCKSEQDVDLGKTLNNAIKLRQIFNQRGRRGTSLGHRPLEERKEMSLSARRGSLAKILNVINPFANELSIDQKPKPLSYLLLKRANEPGNGFRMTFHKKKQIRCDHLNSRVKTESIEPWDVD